jgi:D-mannonate dehydratase
LFPASTPFISEVAEEYVETSKEPIFVKISKYKEALSSFEMLKKKVYETSSILEKIREIKQQEEMQIEEWQKELEIIKEKLNAINNKLFLKV